MWPKYGGGAGCSKSDSWDCNQGSGGPFGQCDSSSSVRHPDAGGKLREVGATVSTYGFGYGYGDGPGAEQGPAAMGNRQMSVASDSKLLEEEINQEINVILRPRRPPRPKSEACFLDRVAGDSKRKSKRYSAFGVRDKTALTKFDLILIIL